MMASAENQDIKLFWTQETLPDLTPEAVARRGPSETGLLGLSAATFAWHRDLFDRFGAIDPDKSPIISDWILPFRAILLNGITYLNKPLVRVRRHVGARWRRFFADSGNANSQGEQSCANAIVQRRYMQETLEDFLCANPKATSRFGHLRKVLAGALEEDLADWISSRNRLMREELRPSWVDPDTLLRQSDAFEKKLEVMRSELKASRAHAKKVEGALLRQSCAFEKKLEVNRSELRASRAQGKKLEAELVRTQKQTAIFKARLAAVYGSHSWRLTAPLRIVFELVRPALSAHWLKRGFPKKDPR